MLVLDTLNSNQKPQQAEKTDHKRPSSIFSDNLEKKLAEEKEKKKI